MYIFPGYVDHYEEDGTIFVTSRLRQNTVKLTDPEIIEEFRSVVRCGGCTEIATPLSHFLHEQELLVEEPEAVHALDELRSLLNESLLLTIMPTEGCNFRCPYCYEDHRPLSMGRKTLDQIQDYIAKQAPHYKHINIAWFGGEPTLCKDTILETAELVQTLQKTNNFLYTSNMTTNGYLLGAADFRKYFQAGITSYQITLDGWNHDKTRPHVSGRGTLHRILENLTALSALSQETYPFQIALRHNILPGDEDLSWYDHLNRLFGKDPRFSVLVRPVSNWGGDSVQSMELLNGEAAHTLLQKHIAYLEEIGMPCGNRKKGPLSWICYASYPHSMVFRPSGAIEKCTICLDHPKNQLGVIDPEKGIILDNEIEQLWSGATLKSECTHCKDALSCLNLQCKMAQIINGDKAASCTDHLLDMY